MISILLSLVILLLVFSLVWFIITRIPIPPDFQWIVQIVLAIIFVICLIELFVGGFNFAAHPLLR